MVKLKVTVRVIPEDTYLANTESTSTQTAPFRGEKRFFVIVREPETWYIGTLALEIQKRYASLYKQDLGEIKYLKDNVDDCDLDPELYVSDALVDEGKALVNPADQHVTIRVIQEQGRAVRRGSVVPDLSQVHYRVPERTPRPPVPKFEDLSSTLGKRKADDGVVAQDILAGKKRTRLDEIEEPELLPSIEQDTSVRSNVTVEDSRSIVASSPVLKQHTAGPVSPELTWSFNGTGPPVSVSAPQHRAQDVMQDAHVGDEATSNVSNRSQESNRRSKSAQRRLQTPKLNGLTAKSPLAAASSASKKFLQLRRDVYDGPESEIDDSQMSPGSRDTSLITPRLVANKRASKEQRRIGESKDNVLQSEDLIMNDYGLQDRRGSAESSTTSTDENEIQTAVTYDKNVTGDAHEVIASEPFVPETLGSQDTGESDTKSDRSEQSSELQNGSTAGSNSSHSVVEPQDLTREQVVPSLTINGSRAGHESANETALKKPDEENQEETPSLKKRNRNRKRKVRPSGGEQSLPDVRNVSTPIHDSPGEQLSQALRESARKPASRKRSISEVTRESDLLSSKGPKMLDDVGKPRSGITSDSESSNESPEKVQHHQPNLSSSYPSTQAATIQTKGSGESGQSKQLLTSAVAKRETLQVPLSGRAVRETSAESQTTTVSKTIVPPGMTQEQYDRLVRQFEERGPVDLHKPKRRSTPSLRKTPSVEVPPSTAGKPTPKTRAGTKAVAAKPPTTTEKSTRLSKSLSADTEMTDLDSEGKTDTRQTRSGKHLTPVVKPPARGSSKPDNEVTVSKPTTAKKGTTQKPPSKASASIASEESEGSHAKVASEAGSTASESIESEPQAGTKVTAPSVSGKRPTPTPSIVSKVTSSSTKQASKQPAVGASQQMRPPSVSSSVKTSAVESTPTPKPRPKLAASSTPAKSQSAATPRATAATTKPLPKPARPNLRPDFSSARSLQELAAMRSAANSTASSPGPTTSRFALPKKDILNRDSSSEEDTDSSTEESNSDAPAPAPLLKSSSSQQNPSSTTNKTPSTLKARPDPTIRDGSSDSEDASAGD